MNKNNNKESDDTFNLEEKFFSEENKNYVANGDKVAQPIPQGTKLALILGILSVSLLGPLAGIPGFIISRRLKRQTVVHFFVKVAYWLSLISIILSATGGVLYLTLIIAQALEVTRLTELLVGFLAIFIPPFAILRLIDKELSWRVTFLMTALFAILAVFAILFFLIREGFPPMAEIGFYNFIFGTFWWHDQFHPDDGVYGIFPMIAGTIVAAAGALIVGGFLGLLTAIFLAKFCPRRIKPYLTQVINLLAGVPSVIYGFFGISIIVPILSRFSPYGMGTGPLAVSIVLGIMILPTVVALTRSSIDAVSKTYYEAAIALGASKERAIFKAVIPAAKSGILAALILGIGRAVGETMAVIMVAGNGTNMPTGLFQSFRTLTANVVMEMGYAMPGSLHMGALIATGLVLLFFILVLNVIFNIVKHTGNNKNPRLMPKIKKYARACVEACGNFVNEKILRRQKNKEEIDKETFKFENAVSNSFLMRAWLSRHKVLRFMSYVTSTIAVLFLGYILFFVLSNGLQHISWHLLTGDFDWGAPPTLAPSIRATLMYVLLTSLIAFPLGIFTAIYLVEYTKKGSRVAKAVEFSVETLEGVPSIVYALFGLMFFVGFLGLGMSIAAGALTVAILILPLTVRATQESLKAVPDAYREAAYALGAGRIRAVGRVVVPTALPGILAMIILGIGRMVSETAALMFTMGSSRGPMPEGFGSHSTTLSVAFYDLWREARYPDEAFAAASILIIIVLALNLFATLVASRLRKRTVAD
ncbi:MAG: phosphate ABC transporter permease subunit PstC [Firmicutes bacterium]|nr:phosphate ABC transporter permease subunit PstC [Bacillota bacterium]